MALDIDGIINAVASHAEASGWFDRFNGHEPKNAPGNGLTGAVWVEGLRLASSGLSSSSALLVLNVRMYTSMLQEPQDRIDPVMLQALSDLYAAYAGDFTLGGLVRHVDLRGADGIPLTAKASYINQDQRMYRVLTITLPLVVNDAWDEAA